jgi:hypothetical protein
MRRRAVVVVIAVVAGARWLGGHRDQCRLDPEHWQAEAPFYDYLNYVALERGSGEMVYGDHQVVRTELRFRYESADGVITFAYDDGYVPRRVGYRVDDGDFEIIEPGPGGDRKMRFRCRLRFDSDPFPPDAYHHPRTDYYACPVAGEAAR